MHMLFSYWQHEWQRILSIKSQNLLEFSSNKTGEIEKWLKGMGGGKGMNKQIGYWHRNSVCHRWFSLHLWLWRLHAEKQWTYLNFAWNLYTHRWYTATIREHSQIMQFLIVLNIHIVLYYMPYVCTYCCQCRLTYCAVYVQ